MRLFRPRLLRLPLAVLALLVVSLAAGCGRKLKQLPVFPVEGKVVYQGRAPAGANVVLIPLGPDGQNRPRPTAVVQNDGTFQVRTYTADDGAPAGKYKVTLQWYKPVKKDGEFIAGNNLLPARYADPQKTDLEIEVLANAANQLPPLKLLK